MNKTKKDNNVIKEKKGVTLISLVIYMTLMFVVLAVIMRVMTHFRNNMDEVSDVSLESETDKINLYMIEETKVLGNGINDFSESKIEFYDGNIFEFKDEDEDESGEIYFNEVKLCKDIKSCIFNVTKDLETLNSTITITINVNDNESTLKYVMPIHTTKLPELFQEVEYIESTGTQYIDTGIKPSGDIKWVLDNEFIDIQSSGYYYNGVYDGNADAVTRVDIGVGYSYLYLDFGELNRILNYGKFSDYRCVYIVDAKNMSCKYDETVGTIPATTNTTSDSSIYLFARNSSGNATYYCKQKTYASKIYKNDILIQDLTPCYRKLDGEIGLFDLVNNKFYKNNGTGTFLKGNSANEVKENNYALSTKLPRIYQEIEYISTTDGGAYINTGVVPNDNFGYKIELTTTNKTADRAVVGVRQGPSADTRCWFGYYNGGIWYGWNYVYPPNSDRPTANSDGYDVIEVNFKNNRQFVVNGVSIDNALFPTLTNMTRPFCLMGINSTGSCYGREQTMKYAIFTEGEVITNYFIPCYRKSDGVIGLYDIIGEGFYTNSGTSAFLKGRDVN